MKEQKVDGLAPAERPTILLIDNEDYIRELIGAILQIKGYEVLQANGPGEALNHAGGGKRIDLILCDAILSGGFMGADLVMEIKRLHPEADALLVTGFPDAAFGSRGLKVLHKPFTPKTLMMYVERLARARSEVSP